LVANALQPAQAVQHGAQSIVSVVVIGLLRDALLPVVRGSERHQRDWIAGFHRPPITFAYVEDILILRGIEHVRAGDGLHGRARRKSCAAEEKGAEVQHRRATLQPVCPVHRRRMLLIRGRRRDIATRPTDRMTRLPGKSQPDVPMWQAQPRGSGAGGGSRLSPPAAAAVSGIVGAMVSFWIERAPQPSIA